MLLVTIDTKIKIIYNKVILEKATYVGGKMLGTLNLDAVNSFLNTCRKEIKKGNHYFVGYRKININGKKISAKQALIDIGIMKEKDIWKHIQSLEVNDCVKIDRDYDRSRDMNSEIYVFKKIINTKMVYIKLTINNRGIVCISFHESY